MSKLKLILPGGKAITLASPFKKDTNKLAGLSLVINVISLVSVAAFALLLPLSNTLFNTDSETSTLKFLIFFVITFVVLFILKLLVQGNKFVIDPRGLLMILVFNLILTTVSITITTLRVSNTFGTIGFRYLSGLSLMSLIGLFYFTNIFSLSLSALRRFLDLIVLGTVLYIVLFLASNNQTTNQLIANLPLLTVGFGLLLSRVLTQKNKVWGSLALLVYIIVVLLAIPFSSTTYTSLFFYSISLLISYSLVLGLYIQKNRKEIKRRLLEIKTNVLNFIKVKKGFVPTNKGLADLHLTILLVLPIFILVAATFFYLNIPTPSRNNVFIDLAATYNDGIKSITGGTFTLNENNIRSILLGTGSDNYSPAKPFLVNVLVIHGLVGCAIYLFLWLYFIKLAKELFTKNLKAKNGYKLTSIVLLSVIFLPLILMASYSNLLTVILLWIMFAVTTALLSGVKLDYFDNSVEVKANKLPVTVAKLLAALFTVSAGVLVINLLFGVIK